MQRAILAIVVLVIGCAPPTPLGVYRLPVQTGAESMQMTTLLVRAEGEELVLRGALRNDEFGRAMARSSWLGEPQPYHFGEINGFPFTLFVRDGVIEDIEARPWRTQPVAPVVAGINEVSVVVLASGRETSLLMQAGELTFAETPMSPPAADAIPGPLEMLGSISGAGLVLRQDAGEGAEWKDAVSAQVPVVAQMALPCGMPLRSLYRSLPGSTVSVPAGDFEAVHVTEIVDVCPGSTVAPTVWKVERWYAPGVGPVRMLATLADGKVREYHLVDTNASGNGASLWPLSADTWWDWRVFDPDGNVVEDAVRVAVESVEARAFPE